MDQPNVSVVIPPIGGAQSEATHPFFLTFVDKAAEERYCRFQYVTSSFWGGKLWHALALAINVLFFIWYHGVEQGFNEQMFVGPMWIGMTVNTAATCCMGAALFVEPLYEYRELFFLVSLITHWPSFLLTTFFGMGSIWPWRYFFVIGCLFFCTFVVQCRFVRVFWILGLSPIMTLIISTSTIKGYWNETAPAEVVLWLLLFIPPAMLRMFEVISRRCFVRMEHCEQQIEQVNMQIERTQDLIANFFAKTPTRDFLSEGRRATRSRRYPDTAVIITDLAGFTAWTSKTHPRDVIRTLGRMFSTIDTLSIEYDVEKVSTVGDCFIGAVFPSEVEKSVRASNAAKFSTIILNSGGALQLRIGINIGLVTAAFVGNRPPKFDLFGAPFEETKTMESSGVPGRVHATHNLISAAASAGYPVEPTTSPLGKVFDRWISKDSSQVLADCGSVVEFFSPHEVFNICQALIKLSGPKKGAQQQQNSLAKETKLEREPSTRSLPLVRHTTTTSFESCPLFDRAAQIADKQPGVLVQQPSIELENFDNMRSTTTLSVPPPARPLPSFVPFDRRHDGVPPPESAGSSLHQQDAALPGEVLTASGSSAHLPRPTTSVDFLSLRPRLSTIRAPSFRRSSQPEEERYAPRPPPSSTSVLSSIASRFSAMGNEQDVAMSPLLLQFDDPENETLFKVYLQKTNIVQKSRLAMVALEVLCLFCLIFLGCMESMRNRVLFMLMLVVISGFIALLVVQAAISSSSILTLAVFVALSVLSLFLDSECSAKSASLYTMAVSFGLFQNTILVTQFMLEYRLAVRIALNIMCCVIGQLGVVVRNTMLDGGAPWDPVFIVGILGLGFVSYFADFTLRTAFAAERLLSIVLRRMRGKHHETARAAMDVMLPQFVSQRLLGSKEGHVDDAAEEIEGDEAGALLHGRQATETLWEFESLCVMFIAFDPDDDDMDRRLIVINEVLDEMEAILSAGGVHKIKTISSTLMCASGIGDEQDHVKLTVMAAAEIVRRLLSPQGSWKFTVGIHVGPCFGAVLGSKSLIFDIFSDAVNLASRMSSTAHSRSVQVTDTVIQHCGDTSSLTFRDLGSVYVKGKGDMKTYELML